MKKFLVERNVPDIGDQSEDEYKTIDANVEWLESIVTNDKVFCVYQATDESAVRKHVAQGNLPVNRIFEIKTVLTPETEHMTFKASEIERPVDRQLN